MRVRRFGLFALLIATSLLYLPVILDCEFVYDDIRFIVDNKGIQSLDSIGEVFYDPARMTSDFDRDIYRPLRTLSFAINWSLAGPSPWIFHLENLIWHLLVVTLAYSLATRLGLSAMASMGCTGVFALHPVMTESVSWISSRGDLMASAFLLSSVLLFLRPTRTPYTRCALVIVFTLLSMFSKEVGVAAPFLCVSALVALRSRPDRSQTLTIAFLFVLVGGFTLLRGRVLAQDYPGQLPFEWNTLLDRVSVELRGILTRVRIIVWPKGLSIEHPTPLPIGALGAIALGVLATLLGLLLKKRGNPSMRFGILLFIFYSLPTSHAIFGVRSVVAERFLYLPVLGITLIMMGILTQLPPPRRWVLASFLLLPLLAFQTHLRNRDWRDQESLFQSVQKVYPDSPHALFGLGAIAFEKRDADRAKELFEKLTSKVPLEDPRHLGARFRLAQIALGERDLDRAAHWLDPILTFEAQHEAMNLHWFQDVYLAQADWFSQCGQYEEALGVLSRYRNEFGESSLYFAGMGQNFELLGRFTEAESSLRNAVSLDETTSFSVRLLGLYLLRRGRLDEAERVLQDAISRWPHDPGLSQVLGQVRASSLGR